MLDGVSAERSAQMKVSRNFEAAMPKSVSLLANFSLEG